MRKKTLSLFTFVIGIFGYCQSSVFFDYDEAGNQKYRGPASFSKQSSDDLDENKKKVSVSQPQAMDEKTFWKQIRLYPVPVNDVLTIDWTDELDQLIESVSLYQHSTVHWKFQQQNAHNLNKQLRINMTGYDWGVYVLHFTLKDGRVFSRNVTKR